MFTPRLGASLSDTVNPRRGALREREQTEIGAWAWPHCLLPVLLYKNGLYRRNVSFSNFGFPNMSDAQPWKLYKS